VHREAHESWDVTPFLLERFAAETGGESLRANRLIIVGNARLAARIAGALSALGDERS
jgi:pseudouridine-5'-phosphate glycosidase